MRTYIVFVACIGMFLTTPAYASTTDVVKKTVNDVVNIVSSKEFKHDSTKRRQALKQTISTIFDYSEMAKRSLGKHWNDRTPAERMQFVGLFETLLETSYAEKIESYDNENIVYGKETVDGDYSEVKSRIITPSHDEYSLDYRLLHEGQKWMVYDVVIEGVSLVSNYRSQFNRIITEQSYAELIKKLQNKSNEIKSR